MENADNFSEGLAAEGGGSEGGIIQGVILFVAAMCSRCTKFS